MAYSNRCLNFMYVLVLAIVIFTLVGSSLPQTMSGRKDSGLRIEKKNSYEASVGTLVAKLPKGTPLPPSGPSPDIN